MVHNNKTTTHALEEIADVPEAVIDLTEEDIVIDYPEAELVSGELEEIMDLPEASSSSLIIEDEHPPVQQLSDSNSIINMTMHVDAVSSIRAVKESVRQKVIKEKELQLFEDIPAPMEQVDSLKNKYDMDTGNIYVDIDANKRQVKAKIYYDAGSDALYIEDITDDDGAYKHEEFPADVPRAPRDEPKVRPIEQAVHESNDELLEPHHTAAQDADILTIEIPPEVRMKIDEKEMADFHFINLDEAEQIADEEILILTEDDLIEELDEYDLIPVENAVKSKIKIDVQKQKSAGVKPSVTVPSEPRKAELMPEEKKAPDKQQDDIRHSIDEGVEEIIIGEEKLDETIRDKKIAGHSSEIQSKEIFELSDKIHETPIKDSAIAPKESAKEDLPVMLDPVFNQNEIRKEEVISNMDTLSAKSDASKQHKAESVSLDEENAAESTAINMRMSDSSYKTQKPSDGLSRNKIEVIPSDFINPMTDNQKILIIDDAGVDVEEVRLQLDHIDDIDRLVSGMIEITEGEAKILHEATAKEEERYIAPILTGTFPAFHDRIIDFEEEFKFKDDDIVFVDNAIRLEEYDKYLKVIDDYYETKIVKKGSATIELFGLNSDELLTFYNVLFEKEYTTVKASKTFKDVTVGRDQPVQDHTLVKQFKYIEARPQSLTDKEKLSIEEDIESPIAVVIEENVDDIVDRLKILQPNADIKSLLQQSPVKMVGAKDMLEDESVFAGRHKDEWKDEAVNITNQVVILDSREDISRFIDTLPVEKQENIRKLLKYLDSLFEKLPEDVIKKFADSEYFDLYVKVFNELGV